MKVCKQCTTNSWEIGAYNGSVRLYTQAEKKGGYNMQKVKTSKLCKKKHSDPNLASKSKHNVSYASICTELLTINIHSHNTASQKSSPHNNKAKMAAVRKNIPGTK